ncbi:MAG: DUF4468 domain-containing protein [Bacteroidota bacterium]|nr:DUF4468 domain-containing protein [Bacteroidota bacterium]MDX5431533.1 DUF4468 domain-containing protein [Bacteroidota bacterium]MDX5470254.1 DUF4468 domain-containing protein [Bacteroidota bacterium]
MKRSIITFSALFALLVGGPAAFAQYEDDGTGYDNYYDYESNPDSTEDPNQDYDAYDPYYGDEGDNKPKKPEKKPYVRITMPFDTITELITYTGIVEQEDSYYDSLYLRAKRYLMGKFDLKDKDFKESALNMDKIIMTLKLPYNMQVNKFKTEQVGNLEFKLALRFKDGKYKYDIDHLKHVMPENAAGKTQPEYAYLEYYMRAERNIIYNDLLLRAADKEINSLIGEIQKALREPVLIDEDDW